MIGVKISRRSDLDGRISTNRAPDILDKGFEKAPSRQACGADVH